VTEAPEQVAAENETATTLTTGLDLVEAESGLRAQLRVRADLVDRLVNEAGEMAISRSRIEGELRNLKLSLGDLTENVARMRTQLRELEIQAESQIESRRAEAEARHAEFDPLEMDRFTRFQELTRMMAESVNDVATVQNTLLRNLDAANLAASAQARINRDISQNLMNVRMTPFQSVADRLYRVVRQTAKELDRRANLDIRGGTTEMDRSVLEAMVAPIEHLLRNALAHGLEGRAERLAAHKTEQGEITLSVGLDGNEVLLEIADDGAGLNIERIRSESIRRGLLNADEFHDDRTVAQAIFQTGFSTASEVTAIAGRGVGLDVVRSEVAALGGRIEVDWQPGLGTTFRIHLPVTLTLTQAVLVRCDERIYAIPSSIVAQASELKPEVIERIRQEGYGEWQGASHAWHYLPRLLGTPEAQPIPQRRHWLIYLKGGADRIAVEVDDLIGGQEIVVKNIGPQLARVPGIAGATVLSDGQIVLILNPTALAQRAPQRTPHGAATAAPVAEVARALPRVLVVDDSLTVRKITSRLLERSGYEVETAKDGVDALEKLLDVLPDVILADIEMPRMDGFDLVRNIRSDERLKHLPVIMITSRTAEKHQAYAREIGVNHYLGKPYDEDELLRLIAGFVHH
jgi:chemosensory pili system protein ChpA (sensor histidine kinase/response regulator)